GSLLAAENDGVFEAFDSWVREYRAAPAEDGEALTPVGVALARERRVAMRSEIAERPARALTRALEAEAILELPSVVRELLETEVSGQGDFLVVAVSGSHSESGISRRVRIGGESYRAYAGPVESGSG